MADVTTYKYCIMAYSWGGNAYHVGEVRVATDAAIVAHPEWWVALTDAEMTSGKKLHI